MMGLERGRIYKWQRRGSFERGLLEMWGEMVTAVWREESEMEKRTLSS